MVVPKSPRTPKVINCCTSIFAGQIQKANPDVQLKDGSVHWRWSCTDNTPVLNYFRLFHTQPTSELISNYTHPPPEIMLPFGNYCNQIFTWGTPFLSLYISMLQCQQKYTPLHTIVFFQFDEHRYVQWKTETVVWIILQQPFNHNNNNNKCHHLQLHVIHNPSN